MVTETEVHYRQPCYDSARMSQRKYSSSPTPETVSSAADAMLKLSTCGGIVVPGATSAVHQQQSGYVVDGSSTAVTYPEMRGSATMSGMMFNSNNSNSNSSNSQEYRAGSQSPSSTRIRSNSFSRTSRKEREFVPDYRKDDHYWVKRQKNNEAAKRSREKRRVNDMVMSEKVKIISDEKDAIQNELDTIKRHFGLPLDKPFRPDEDINNIEENPTYSSSVASVSSASSVTASSASEYRNTAGSINLTGSSSAINLTPIQGRLAEVIAERMIISAQPPPLQSVPDSPGAGSISSSQPDYHRQQHVPQYQEDIYYNNKQNHNYSPVIHCQQEQIQDRRQESPVAQQHYQMQQHHQLNYESSQSPSHSMGYSNTSSQSPHSSLSSPQNLQIVLSPLPASSNANDADIPASPLNLSKRRRITLNDDDDLPMNCKQYSSSHQSSPQSLHEDTSSYKMTPPRAEERKGIPHKLRYKNYSNEICMSDEQDSVSLDHPSSSSQQANSHSFHQQNSNEHPAGQHTSSHLSVANVYQHTIHHLSSDNGNRDQTMDQSDSSFEMSYSMASGDTSGTIQPGGGSNHDSSSNNTGYSPLSEHGDEADPRYTDRRERNNFAARKCRENRRLINELRMVKSQVLENENEKLKDELKSLTDEVHGLKRMIEKKHEAKATGEHFDSSALTKDSKGQMSQTKG